MPTNAGLGYNLILGAKKAIENANSNPFNNMPFLENGTGIESVKVSRAKFAPKADDPTVAGADPSMKLPDAQQSVDPQAIASILKNMLQMLAKAAATSNATSPPAISNTVTDALTGALSILATNYGFDNLLNILINTFANDQFDQLEKNYDEIIINAIVSLVENVTKYGENNLPYLVVPKIIVPTVNSNTPSPIVSSVPDLYLQVYYISENNPFPGYVTWEGPSGDFIYTLSTATTPPYTSASIAITTSAQQELVADLTPYIISGSLTVVQLNAVLDMVFANTQANGLNNSLGNNASNNMMQLLQQLLGILGPIINNTKNNHLPPSVLNQQSVNKSLEKFSKNMSIIKKMKSDTTGAFNIQSLLSQLSSIGGGSVNLSSIISILNTGGMSPSSIISLLNSGLTNSSVSSLNTVAINNPTLTANNIGTIASITTTLQNANVVPSEISSIQLLLSEIINVNQS